jgi:hypothetical protein
MAIIDINTNFSQFLRNIRSIGIDNLAEQKLRASGDQLCIQGGYLLPEPAVTHLRRRANPR